MNTAIPALLITAAAILWWLSAVNAHERARQVAARFCQANGWQLLDQTVSLRRLRPRRSATGWALMRFYRFEFSPDGGSRLSGEVHFAGVQALRILARTPEGRMIEEIPPGPTIN